MEIVDIIIIIGLFNLFVWLFIVGYTVIENQKILSRNHERIMQKLIEIKKDIKNN